MDQNHREHPIHIHTQLYNQNKYIYIYTHIITYNIISLSLYPYSSTWGLGWNLLTSNLSNSGRFLDSLHRTLQQGIWKSLQDDDTYQYILWYDVYMILKHHVFSCAIQYISISYTSQCEYEHSVNMTSKKSHQRNHTCYDTQNSACFQRDMETEMR